MTSAVQFKFNSIPFHSNVSLASKKSSKTMVLEEWNQKHTHSSNNIEVFVCFLHTLNNNSLRDINFQICKLLLGKGVIDIIFGKSV